MSMLRVWPVPVFSDNYVWVLEREGSDEVAVVDPGDGSPVIEAVLDRGLRIAAVLLTHHHHDHVGGLAGVIRQFHPAVFGSGGDGVPGLDRPLEDGGTAALPFLDIDLDVVALPGHTSRHLGYVGEKIAFVGDTLFAGGCGRVFEGTTDQMHDSLSRLASLVPETKAYCAHEYTVVNLRFGLLVEPGNESMSERLAAAETARAAGQPTVPSTIGYELETNVFLRCSEPGVVAAAEEHAQRDLSPGAEVFGVIRGWKDGWSG
jgi:hydroxyacylglutathione hydrolase